MDSKNDNKTRSGIVRVFLGEEMVSEDLEKILAIIIVILSFLSLPILLFLLFVVIYIDATYVVQFYYTRDFLHALISVGLAIVSVGLFLVLLALTKWIRKNEAPYQSPS